MRSAEYGPLSHKNGLLGVSQDWVDLTRVGVPRLHGPDPTPRKMVPNAE
jgi:hypothetical protein